MTTALAQLFEKTRSENRAALIAYIPAGYPTQEGCKAVIDAFADAGVDAIEIGFPYSDPVMDGPTIQEASNTSLNAGTGAKEVFEALAHATSRGIPSVVMTYWNPIEKYGTEAFAASIASNSGSGVITPDLPPDESDLWITATDQNKIDRVFVVAPSSSEERLKLVTNNVTGFVYAASLMGVTGTRTEVSSRAEELVKRIRVHTQLPVAVGLGVSTSEQAHEVAKFADGVIVGSAFVKAILEQPDLSKAVAAVVQLSKDFARGVRKD